MEIPNIFKAGMTLVILLYVVFKYNRQRKKEPEDQFLTIDDKRNNELRIDPAVPEAAFAKLQAEYAAKPYDKYDNLVYKFSELLLDPLAKISKQEDSEKLFAELNRSQRIFSLLLQLEGQINNGGVYQFLWNRGESMMAAQEALWELNIEPLAADYEKVLDELEAATDNFIKDREFWVNVNHSEAEKWKVFQDGRNYIPTGKKIEEYFYTEEFAQKYHQKIIDYVIANKEHFGVGG